MTFPEEDLEAALYPSLFLSLSHTHTRAQATAAVPFYPSPFRAPFLLRRERGGSKSGRRERAREALRLERPIWVGSFLATLLPQLPAISSFPPSFLSHSIRPQFYLELSKPKATSSFEFKGRKIDFFVESSQAFSWLQLQSVSYIGKMYWNEHVIEDSQQSSSAILGVAVARHLLALHLTYDVAVIPAQLVAGLEM